MYKWQHVLHKKYKSERITAVIYCHDMHVKEGEMKVQVIFILVANSYGKINISIRFQKVNYVLTNHKKAPHRPPNIKTTN